MSSVSADMNAWPWAQDAWERTTDAIETLHHALLITGVPGIAKREFAMALSQLLLCEASADADADADADATRRGACGKCHNCTLFQAATHPDFHVLTTELEARDGRIDLVAQYCNRYQDAAAREKRANPSRVIPVDQVRLLSERFSVHAHTAARKVALLLPADRMNANAANALLKLLEEPPANSVLMLVSATPGYLPATIRSRCFHIAIPPPTPDAARAWLLERLPADEVTPALAHFGPVDALKMSADGLVQDQAKLLQEIERLADGKISALELAAELIRHDFSRTLEWLHRLSGDLIKHGCGIATPAGGHALATRQPPAETLFALYDKIGYYRKIARDQLNEQLAMEELALTLQHALRA